MYQLQKPIIDGGKIIVVLRVKDITFIPFDPANTDYQQFKQAINDDNAQLEDADGVLMTPDDAKAFIATLP